MDKILEFIKHNAKAVAAALVGVILSAIQAVINGQVPWPTSLAEWGKYLGAAVISYAVVWATGNKLTVSQITKGAVEQGVTVISGAAIDTVANAAQNVVVQATENLPVGVGAKTAVNDVAQQVSDTVVNVLKNAASNFPSIPLDLKNVL